MLIMLPKLVIDNTMKRVQKYDRWHPVPKELEDEVIAYYLDGHSALESSRKFGVSAQKVLERRGIPIRRCHSSKTFGKIDEIIKLYSDGLTPNAIGKIIGVSQTRIAEIVKESGVEMRSIGDYRPKSSGKEKEIIAMYQSGISSKDTGIVFGVCESTVLCVLKQNGIAKRRAGCPVKKNALSKNKAYMRKKQNTYRNNRKKIDPLYKVTQSIRSRISSFFRRGKLGKTGIIRKHKKTVEMLGADYDVVFMHITAQLKDGVTWETYGQKGWHIDHKIPLCSAKNEDDLLRLLHYTNLQPLSAKDNHKKGGKICL